MGSHRLGTVVRVALLVLAVSAVAAAAQGQGGWKIVGQVGGLTSGVAVQGSHAYVGVGWRLVVLDISNPADLREIGVTQPFPHFVEDIAISGSLAYVAAGGAGLRVVDISTPALPTEVGAWDSPGYSGGVAVAGTTVYLADGPYGLRVLDVSKPSQPVEVGSAYTMDFAFKVAVQGHHAYVAAAGAGLLVADVTDPRHPVEVGSLATAGYAYGVAVAGDVAYVADGWEGIKIVNVADPAHPCEIGSYKTPGWAFGVTLAGTTAYVADAFGGLRVLDVTDPTHPLETARAKMPAGHARSVAVAGDVAYVVDRSWGVRAVSLIGGSELSQVASYHPLVYADGVAVAGSYAYVAAGDSGLWVVDVSDPARPRQVGSLEVGGFARDVCIRADLAYLVTMGAGPQALHVVDVSTPAHPSGMGSLPLNPWQGQSLDVAGQVAYIATEDGLDLVSLADPPHPVRLAYLPLVETELGPNATVGVAVSGTMAYVASQTAGVRIVDVSDPRNPFKVGAYDSGSHGSLDVAIVGNTLYVADGPYGLRVVDISDPPHPIEMGTLGIVGGAYGVAVAGNLAYVANGDKGLFVVDVSDPYRPTPAGVVQIPGYARQVAVAGGKAYLADGTSGLVIVEKTTAAAAASAGNRLDAGWMMDRPIGSSRPLPFRMARGNVAPSEARTQTARSRSTRQAASTCVVTSLADSGTGTLRFCLQNTTSGTTITFDPAVFPPSNPATIRPASTLPSVDAGNITIDGSDAGTILDGSSVTQPGWGLFIPSDGNTVRGLQILRFSGTGISITGSHNLIGGDRALGRGPVGQGNVISGNGGSGVEINGGFGTAFGNTVVGNLIGTDVSGMKAFGNTNKGVFVAGGANNRIGGLDPRDRNVVSANDNNGITINGPGTGNLVAGNYVGTDASGTTALGNYGFGISMELGGFNNIVQGNLSSGNGRDGVCISDPGSSYNAVLGNRIGTDATGTKAIPNGGCGVLVNVLGGSSFNRIGGTEPGERNLISGNSEVGLGLGSGDVARGNLIGTDITGKRPLANAGGVGLGGGQIHLGGERVEEANVIGGSSWIGIGSASDYNYIAGNYIGTDPTGQAALGNVFVGVFLTGMHNFLGRNVVANNPTGIIMDPLSYNALRRNSIHDNAGKGIAYSRGDAGALGAPVITRVGVRSVAGNACPGCEVEIFSDSEDEGRVFEGSAIADGTGAFTFTKASDYLVGPNVTATATDAGGNTSEFSEPSQIPGRAVRRRLFRPGP